MVFDMFILLLGPSDGAADNKQQMPILPEGLLSLSSQGWAYLYWYPAEVMGSAVGQDQTV